MAHLLILPSTYPAKILVVEESGVKSEWEVKQQLPHEFLLHKANLARKYIVSEKFGDFYQRATLLYEWEYQRQG